ncbi:MAG: peptide/nickel transport system permease protein [Thermomicrobiales bacterium]|nr:peptide/nickel transport system permease protein [Thermomicrobiales bacterium]MEA2593881.1 peptide/nickel transport system permease protein [Thermomicrobiales bacterium]
MTPRRNRAVATTDRQRTLALAAEVAPTRSPRPGLLRLLIRRKASAVGLAICLLTVVVAVVAPVLAPYDPIKIAPTVILKAPSAAHWFGTDELGRDVLTRIIFGARVSIAVGAIAVTIALCCGIVFGMISGYYGGWSGAIIMRTMDALAAFPAILLALAILSALGPGIRNAMIAIGVVYVPAFSRVVRGSVLSVKQNEYVEAARASGATTAAIMRKAIFPNCASPLLVHASLGFANAIIVEAALAFLGLGAQPPTASWGAMLSDGRQFLNQNIWYSISAGAAIFITVLGLNLLGDGLRDILDPRLRST